MDKDALHAGYDQPDSKTGKGDLLNSFPQSRHFEDVEKDG